MRQTKFSFRLLFTAGLFLLFCTFFALPISAANVSLEVDPVLPKAGWALRRKVKRSLSVWNWTGRPPEPWSFLPFLPGRTV